MFPPPDSHERALPTASPSQNCLAAHLVVRGGSGPDRNPPEQKTHPPPDSPLARALPGKALFKGRGGTASTLRDGVTSDAVGGALSRSPDSW
ncbi:unnamed protein product [Rangifer tarandus platyrhynchus]|uniref:Uncharacterized protein n=1 Tax=Rangifer tarandus platyrhynchus TaxID=3082113 RepID=A0ABN8ZS93_RANTA|nr:unnamed protein product [Rangifer tarandus platyrhynchus]